MPSPRQSKINTVLLTLVGVVLAAIAVFTDWPSWLIVVLFVAIAVAAHFVGRGHRTED